MSNKTVTIETKNGIETHKIFGNEKIVKNWFKNSFARKKHLKARIISIQDAE